MITNLPAHTRERIDEIRTLHVPAVRTRWQRLWRRPPLCTMCGVPIGRCLQRKWADEVAAGRRPPAGIPQQRAATWWEY